MEDIRESAVFETYSGGYILAQDSGYFTVGEARDERMSIHTHVQYIKHNSTHFLIIVHYMSLYV